MKNLPVYVTFAMLKMKEPVVTDHLYLDDYEEKESVISVFDNDLEFDLGPFDLKFTFEDKLCMLIPYCYGKKSYGALCKIVNDIVGKSIKIDLPKKNSTVFYRMKNGVKERINRYLVRTDNDHIDWYRDPSEPNAVDEKVQRENSYGTYHGAISLEFEKLLDALFRDISIKEFLTSPNYVLIIDNGMREFIKLVNNTGSAYNASNIISMRYMLGDECEVNYYAR